MTDNKPYESVEIVDSFEPFFDNEELGKLAKLLDEVTREYKAENLTLIEFIEITDDLIQAERVAELTDNVDRQKMLADTLEKIQMVVNLAIGALK